MTKQFGLPNDLHLVDYIQEHERLYRSISTNLRIYGLLLCEAETTDWSVCMEVLYKTCSKLLPTLLQCELCDGVYLQRVWVLVLA